MPTSADLAPNVTTTGITGGSFADWLAYFVSEYQSIYGADVYLGNDSQDGQFIAVIAQACADVTASAIAVYNSFSPATAQGAGLSSVVKINGVQRLVPSASTVILTIVGVYNTTIQNGTAKDANGNIWNLPAIVVIPVAGTVNVTATASVTGAITAPANTITKINSPVFGWQSVTNPLAASPGAPVESDAALRIRQSQSVALPSQTIFDGVVAGLEDLTGVTRVKGYENNGSGTDGNGIPAHTLYFIVEGGAQADIVQTIATKATPGVGLQGSISTVYTDAVGSTRTIKYDVPVHLEIAVQLGIKALAGWQVGFEDQIEAAIIAYINALPGGGTVAIYNVAALALLAGTPAFGTFRITSVTMSATGHAQAATDIVLNYNQMALTAPVDITFAVT